MKNDNTVKILMLKNNNKMRIKSRKIIAFLLSLCLSLPTLAGGINKVDENSENDSIAINSLQNRFNHYKEKITNLEEKNTLLQKSNNELENNLKENDEFLRFIVEKASPLLLSYLRALSKGENENELNRLRAEASRTATFPDLLVRANKQVRASTPNSIIRLLESHGDKISIGATLPSVSYATAQILSTPEKTIEDSTEAFKKSIERRKNTNPNLEGVTQAMRKINFEEQEETKDAIQSSIQDNAEEFGIPLHYSNG